MKRCFIISPIGADGSAIREHADDVFDYIIKPAMEERGIVPLRSDQLLEPGKITDQMYREILESEVCIAVLKNHNPNVFYELGVAQAVGKPVILLNEQGTDLPFDIKDLRSVTYDLKPRNLFEKTFSRQIQQHLEALESTGWKVPPIVAGHRSESVDLQFHSKYQEYGGADRWLQVLREANARLDFLGLSLDSWKNRRGFRDLVIQKAKEGCAVRFLIMDPANPVLPCFSKGYISPKSLDLVKSEIGLMAAYLQEIADETSQIQLRKMTVGCPHSRLVITEKRMLCVPYLFGDHQCPLFDVSPTISYHGTMSEEFEVLWNANPATDRG